MRYYRQLPLIFFVTLVFSTNLVLGTQSFLIYRDFGHKGDENQARGVVHAYSKFKEIDVKEFNIGQEEELKTFVKSITKSGEEKPIILGVGEKTVSSFAQLLPLEEATTVHLCHMVTANHPSLLGKVNYLALPLHSIGGLEKDLSETTTQLIKTIGVAHNRQTEEIERVHREDKEKIPHSHAYLGVILAGDAPTPKNEMLLFTKDNACKLARYVSSILNDRHLLIINGPRTGKHDPETLEEIKTAHRTGQKDFITQAFLDELIKSGLSPKQFTLFDFQFGVSTSKDMDLLLGTIRARANSFVLVPGESTSSISECIDVLPDDAVVVYHNTAMNEVHVSHVKSELEEGRIRLLSSDFQESNELKTPTNKERTPKRSAAETIASEVAQQFISSR